MCKIAEPLFCVLRRFIAFSNDSSLVLSFSNRSGAFVRVLEVYFKVTSKVRPRPDGTNSRCSCRKRTRLHSYHYCNGPRV